MIVCGYCNGPMVKLRTRLGNRDNPRQITVDHVFPTCRPFDMPDSGLMNRPANRVFCCAGCNIRKGNLHPLAWLRIVPGDPRLLIAKLHLLGVRDDVIDPVMQARRDGAVRAA